jgi:hypothetical protein
MKQSLSLLFSVACATLLSASLSFAAPQFGVRVSGGMFDIMGSKLDDPGYAWGVGGTVALALGSSVVFMPELSFVYRASGSYSEGSGASKETIYLDEFALELPLLFRFLLGQTFFLQIGAQGGVGFDTELSKEYRSSILGNIATEQDFDERWPWEAGIVAGFGFRILGNWALDVRYFMPLTDFVFPTYSREGMGHQEILVGLSRYF